MKIRKMFLVLIASLTLITAIPKGNANGIASSSLKNFVLPKFGTLTNSSVAISAQQHSGLYTRLFTEYAIEKAIPTTIVASLFPITQREILLRVDRLFETDNIHKLETFTIGTTDVKRSDVLRTLRNLEIDLHISPDMSLNYKALLLDVFLTIQYALNEAKNFSPDLALPYLALLDARRLFF